MPARAQQRSPVQVRRGPAAVRGSKLHNRHWNARFWEGEASDEPKSEELPVWTHFLTRERRGGDDCTAVLCWQLPSNRLFDNEKAFFNVVYITAWTTVI